MVKDYDFTLQYHSRKANVVVDALSRKMMALSLHRNWKCYEEVIDFNPQVCGKGILLAQLSIVPKLQSHIVEFQQSDAELLKLLEKQNF